MASLDSRVHESHETHLTIISKQPNERQRLSKLGLCKGILMTIGVASIFNYISPLISPYFHDAPIESTFGNVKREILVENPVDTRVSSMSVKEYPGEKGDIHVYTANMSNGDRIKVYDVPPYFRAEVIQINNGKYESREDDPKMFANADKALKATKYLFYPEK